MIDVFTQDFYILFFDSDLVCTRRRFLKTRISRQNINLFRTYVSLFIRGLEKIMIYNGGQKSRDTLPLTQSCMSCMESAEKRGICKQFNSTYIRMHLHCTEFHIKRKYFNILTYFFFFQTCN